MRSFTVPIPVIAGVAVVVLIIILFIIFKILRKRKQSASEESSSSKYQKLENGENEAGPEEGNEIQNSGKEKKKKRKKGGKSKGKSKRKESQDLESGIEDGTGLNDSSVFTDDSPFPLISRLQFSMSYSPSSRQILLTILRGENFGLGSKVPNFEVRVTLLPAKRQRLKTKEQSSGNPVFNELLTFDEVFPEDMESATLRARVYKLNVRQRKLVWELRADLKADLGLDTIDVNQLWRELTPAADIAVR